MKGSSNNRNVGEDKDDKSAAAAGASGRQDSGYSSSFIDSGLIPDIPPEEPASEEKTKQFDSGVDIGEHSATDSQPLSSKETFALWKGLFTPDEDYDTPLHLCIAHGDLERAFKIIKLAPHPDFLNLSNFNSETPLHCAVLYNHPTAVRRLVVCGAALHLQDCWGNTALHLACSLGRLECAHSLTAPVTASELRHASPVYSVAAPPHVSLGLLDRRNYEGEAALHLAVLRNHRPLVELLIELKASINIKEGKAGRTPLHLAVSALNLGLVELLLGQPGAEINCPNYGGLTPLDELRLSCTDHFNTPALCSMRDLLLQHKAHSLEYGLPESDESGSEDDGEEFFLDLQGDNKPTCQTVAG